MEDLKRILAGAVLDDLEGAVDDALCSRLLAVLHDDVHELGHLPIAILGVGHDWTLGNFSATGHRSLLLLEVFRATRAVLGATLPTIRDTLRIEGTANDVVANTGKVFDTTTANEHGRVLLEVVAFTGDVGGDLHSVCQTNTGDLTER
jgi:hypothetical protein